MAHGQDRCPLRRSTAGNAVNRVSRATGMLASVTSVAEARMALAAGADILDLKDPASGALGALPLETIRNIVTSISGRRPVSATVGDLVDVSGEQLGHAVEAVAATGVDYVKVGYFPGVDPDSFMETLSRSTDSGVAIVVVLFADAGWPPGLVDALADRGIAGVMLDTAMKDGRSLLNHLPEQAIVDFLRQARLRHLITGLAGSLSIQDIPRLLPLAPDYLGFRGALCDRRNRQLGVDRAAMARVRSAVTGHDAPRAPVSG